MDLLTGTTDSTTTTNTQDLNNSHKQRKNAKNANILPPSSNEPINNQDLLGGIDLSTPVINNRTTTTTTAVTTISDNNSTLNGVGKETSSLNHLTGLNINVQPIDPNLLNNTFLEDLNVNT